MEIAPEKAKKIIGFIFVHFKALESEILAQRLVLFGLKVLLDDPGEIERGLEQARQSPALQQVMNEKYDAELERLLRLVDQAKWDQEFSKWIASWKPKGPPD